jgi:hypothetical protein
MRESLDEWNFPMVPGFWRGTVPLAFSSLTVGATKWT